MTISAKEAVEADVVLRTLWKYWRDRRGDRLLPNRAEIDPVDIPTILPYLQLIEYVSGRFRFRLTGTAVVESYGAELTGKFVDDCMRGNRSEIAIRHFAMVIDTRKPLFVRNRYERTGGALFIATRIMLPLSIGTDPAAGIILMGSTYEFASTFAARCGMDAHTSMRLAEREFLSD